MGDTPRGLLPDFRAGGGVVGVGVIRVVKLIEQFAFSALGHFQSQVAGPLHPLLFADQDKLGAVSAHRGPTLLAHVVGHQQLHPVAFQRGDHRQRNTGVAAGRFDQHVAGLNFAALFRFDDHRQRGAIFHRAGRIIAFEFDPHFAAVVRSQTLKFDQRGIADGLFECIHDFYSIKKPGGASLTRPGRRVIIPDRVSRASPGKSTWI